jgi:hypothetical protein
VIYIYIVERDEDEVNPNISDMSNRQSDLFVTSSFLVEIGNGPSIVVVDVLFLLKIHRYTVCEEDLEIDCVRVVKA